MANLNVNNINPSVKEFIKPIITRMTEINYAQKTNKLMGVMTYKEPEEYKFDKRKCVHIIYEPQSNEFRAPLERSGDNRFLICTACGRKINCVFDSAATVDKLKDTLEVIDQLLFFGITKGFTPSVIGKLIDFKVNLPEIAKMAGALNMMVKLDNSSVDSTTNIGSMYPHNSFTTFSSNY